MEPRRKLFRLSSPDDAKILCFCSPSLNIYKLKSPTYYTENDMDTYLKMMDDDPVLQLFFKDDGCCRLADKYLIAMVFNYFIRAGYSHIQYTTYNFFVALYLAHDMEEDEEELKNELFLWALGNQWLDLYKNFLSSRDELWKNIGHRGVVSLSSCEKIMSVRPHHWAWQRFRSEVHAGANRTDKYIFTEGASYEKLLTSQAACWNCCSIKFAIESEDAATLVGWIESPEHSPASNYNEDEEEEELDDCRANTKQNREE